MTNNTTPTAPRVYVGTHGKYNAGSISGAWLNLEDYDNASEFYAACSKLHKGEHDPEFMFQDWEGIPADMISESWIDEGLWNFLNLEDNEREMLAAFEKIKGTGFGNFEETLAYARESFRGTAESFLDWVSEYLDDTGFFDGKDETLVRYFDLKAYAHDLDVNGMAYGSHNGTTYVFASV